LGKFPTRQDCAGLAVVAACTAAIYTYRAIYIEPRAWGALCAAAAAPAACLPRAGLLWLQREYLWGGIAAALGLLAFLARGPWPLSVAAVCVGIMAIANFNATWGMVGTALGVWAWFCMGKRKQAVLF
jgi:hypothetical protein